MPDFHSSVSLTDVALVFSSRQTVVKGAMPISNKPAGRSSDGGYGIRQRRMKSCRAVLD